MIVTGDTSVPNSEELSIEQEDNNVENTVQKTTRQKLGHMVVVDGKKVFHYFDPRPKKENNKDDGGQQEDSGQAASTQQEEESAAERVKLAWENYEEGKEGYVAYD